MLQTYEQSQTQKVHLRQLMHPLNNGQYTPSFNVSYNQTHDLSFCVNQKLHAQVVETIPRGIIVYESFEHMTAS